MAFSFSIFPFCGKMLTNRNRFGIIIDVPCDAAYAHQLHGEMSEWFKELVLKTSDPARDRGFESHSLRHIFVEQNRFYERCHGVVLKLVTRLPC